MQGVQEWHIPAKDVKSLCWHGDTLFDWVGGGAAYELDGTFRPRQVVYSYRFDAAVMSPSGQFAVIYEKLGTKGLVLKNGRIIREIDRSFYHADAYEFPVTLFRLPDGRELIAHCPDDYDRIEIDDLQTGERVTDSDDRKPMDCFFSRLKTNQSGTLLLNSGWVWQPFDIVDLYEVDAVLKNPRLLDEAGFLSGELNAEEVNNAAFLKDDYLVVATLDEELDIPNALAIYDIPCRRFHSKIRINSPVGTILPVSLRLIVGFYEHPRLIDVQTGSVLHEWANLNTGKQNSSIIHHLDPIPPIALDPANARFAVADASAIHVVQIDAAAVSATNFG